MMAVLGYVRDAIEKTDQTVDFVPGTQMAGPERIITDPERYWPFVFFSPHEFECSCCGEVFVAERLVNSLETLRGNIGRPIVITSGYRCEQYNADIGGAPSSYHVEGLAVDVAARTWLEKTQVLHHAWISGFQGGIGIYPNFVHLDLGPKRYWKGD